MSLQDEIKAKSSQIFSDSYPMSIGELMNLYKEGELDIHPEFQRLYRWSDFQKTRLIESIMLNIPIPPIFVSQNDDGVWDIIDGVQRLSTIFQFVGILKDENKTLLPRLELFKTEYLPSFAGMKWENDNDRLSFTKEQQLSFKRSKLDINIMRNESDPNTKYELFQRLNTGGTVLSGQEVRNCLMVMSNKKFYGFIDSLNQYLQFKNCIQISERKLDEQYRLELVLRLLVALNFDWNDIGKYEDLEDLLNKETIKLCEKTDFDYETTTSNFEQTYSLLFDVLNEDVFRRYKDSKFTGPFLVSAFQSISFGVYKNLDSILVMENRTDWLASKIKSLYLQNFYIKNTSLGARAVPRFMDLSISGKDYFSQ
jgi:uncharacterized protein with ParB-like and HNH nuclease domain